MYKVKCYKTRQKLGDPVRIVPIWDAGLEIDENIDFLDMREITKLMCCNNIAIHENTTEYTYLVCLNEAGQVTGIAEISKGNLKESYILPADALQHALLLNSRYVIMVHNHPNKLLEASDGDLNVVKILLKAFDAAHIYFMDSIIIGEKNESYSIRKNYPEIWEKD